MLHCFIRSHWSGMHKYCAHTHTHRHSPLLSWFLFIFFILLPHSSLRLFFCDETSSFGCLVWLLQSLTITVVLGFVVSCYLRVLFLGLLVFTAKTQHVYSAFYLMVQLLGNGWSPDGAVDHGEPINALTQPAANTHLTLYQTLLIDTFSSSLSWIRWLLPACRLSSGITSVYLVYNVGEEGWQISCGLSRHILKPGVRSEQEHHTVAANLTCKVCSCYWSFDL